MTANVRYPRHMTAFRSHRGRRAAFAVAVVVHLASLALLAWRPESRVALGGALLTLAIAGGAFAAWLDGVSRNLPALGSNATTPTWNLQRVWIESQAADAIEGSDVIPLLILVGMGTTTLVGSAIVFTLVPDDFLRALLVLPGLLGAVIHLAACLLAVRIARRLEERQAAQWRDLQERAAMPAPDANRLR